VCLSDRDAAAIAALHHSLLQASQEPIELGNIIGAELRTGRAHRRRADGAAAAQDLLAHGKAKPGLLFMVIPIGPLMMLARAGHLKSGDLAPDFRLPVLHTQEMVQLASFRGQKPVALIFGSYT